MGLNWYGVERRKLSLQGRKKEKRSVSRIYREAPYPRWPPASHSLASLPTVHQNPSQCSLSLPCFHSQLQKMDRRRRRRISLKRVPENLRAGVYPGAPRKLRIFLLTSLQRCHPHIHNHLRVFISTTSPHRITKTNTPLCENFISKYPRSGLKKRPHLLPVRSFPLYFLAVIRWNRVLGCITSTTAYGVPGAEHP